MAATMGGTMRSPLTATFFAAELTGNTHILLPLLAACVTAHLVTVLLMRRSILTEKVARRGHHLSREYRVDPFALTRARDVMTTSVQTVPEGMTLHQIAAFLTAPGTSHPSFPVIDADQHVLGIVDPPTVLRWRRAGKHRHVTLRELLAGNRPVTAHPDDYLDGIIERMTRENVAHIAIVTPEDARLAGYIAWRDLMNVRARLQTAERDRVVFYRVR